MELAQIATQPELIVQRLRYSPKLTTNQQDILSTMLVVQPEKRTTLSELLLRRSSPGTPRATWLCQRTDLHSTTKISRPQPKT